MVSASLTIVMADAGVSKSVLSQLAAIDEAKAVGGEFGHLIYRGFGNERAEIAGEAPRSTDD